MELVSAIKVHIKEHKSSRLLQMAVYALGNLICTGLDLDSFRKSQLIFPIFSLLECPDSSINILIQLFQAISAII